MVTRVTRTPAVEHACQAPLRDVVFARARAGEEIAHTPDGMGDEGGSHVHGQTSKAPRDRYVSPLLGELGTSEESSAFLCVTVHHTLLLAVPNEWCNRDVFA